MPNFYHDTSEKRKNQTASWLQKWFFVFKSCISFTNIQLSIYKMASRLTKWHLAFQLSFFYKIFQDNPKISVSLVGKIAFCDKIQGKMQIIVEIIDIRIVELNTDGKLI